MQLFLVTLSLYHCLQSKTHVPEIGISLCSDMCQTASHGESWNVTVKVEEGLEAELGEGPEGISFPEISAECEVSFVCVCFHYYTFHNYCMHTCLLPF
jgi:hypothetical protein